MLGLGARWVTLVPLGVGLDRPRWVAFFPEASLLVPMLLGGTGAGFLLGRRLLSRLDPAALRPLFLPAVAALTWVPGALGGVPLLAVFSGTVLDLILLGSVALSVIRHAESRWGAPRVTAHHVMFASALVSIAVGLRLQSRVGLSGDEPHYLVIVESLLRDRDLLVENNYERGDWSGFYQGKIRPHFAQPGRDGALYSIHGVGLPLLLLPGFAVLGLWGVLATEALLCAFVARDIFRVVIELSGSRGGALLASAGFALTSPALFLGTAAYPELPAASLAAAAFRRSLCGENLHARSACIWGFLLGLSPFLHMKFLPLAAVLALGLGLRSSRRGRWALAAGLVLGWSLLVGFHVVLHGSPNPLDAYGRQRLFWHLIPRGLLGLFFDQEFGLLPTSPFYLVAAVGLIKLARKRARVALVASLALLSVALPGAAHPLWWGGSSPPARFLFPALPALAAVAGIAWGEDTLRSAVFSRRAVSAVVASVVLGGFMVFGPWQPLYLNQRDGTGRVWEAASSSWELTHYLPSVVQGDRRSLVLAALGGGLGVTWLLTRRPHRLALPAAALALAAAIDHTAPPSPPAGSAVRWGARILSELSGRYGSFRELPPLASLSRQELIERVAVPLERGPWSEEARWRSVTLSLPAGRYRLEGEPPEGLRLCNADGCFGPLSGAEFSTGVALDQFRIEGPEVPGSLLLRAVKVGPRGASAVRSIQPFPGIRLHALDEEAFFEPGGFWVRARSLARLAVETAAPSRLVWSFTNGARENWIEVSHPTGRLRFSLRPREEKRLELSLSSAVETVSVSSASGFVPSETNGLQSDRRPLGVFVTVLGPAPR